MRHPKKNIFKVGSLRVWNITNPPNDGNFFPVKTPSDGKKLIDALANSQLLDENIVSNVFGMEIMDEDGEWMEWEDDDGGNITDDDVKLD